MNPFDADASRKKKILRQLEIVKKLGFGASNTERAKPYSRRVARASRGETESTQARSGTETAAINNIPHLIVNIAREDLDRVIGKLRELELEYEPAGKEIDDTTARDVANSLIFNNALTKKTSSVPAIKDKDYAPGRD